METTRKLENEIQADERREQIRAHMMSIRAREEEIKAEERRLRNREHMACVAEKRLKVKDILETVQKVILQGSAPGFLGL